MAVKEAEVRFWTKYWKPRATQIMEPNVRLWSDFLINRNRSIISQENFVAQAYEQCGLFDEPPFSYACFGMSDD